MRTHKYLFSMRTHIHQYEDTNASSVWGHLCSSVRTHKYLFASSKRATTSSDRVTCEFNWVPNLLLRIYFSAYLLLRIKRPRHLQICSGVGEREAFVSCWEQKYKYWLAFLVQKYKYRSTPVNLQRRGRAGSCCASQLVSQYLHFCTSKASKLSTCCASQLVSQGSRHSKAQAHSEMLHKKMASVFVLLYQLSK